MCTVVTLRRPGHDWPLLIAANRDEMQGRTWSPPARHWPERPATVAGKDHQAGGSWLGGNDDGVAVAILVVIVAAWTLATTFVLFTVLKKTLGLRVSEEEELAGLDVSEHGGPGLSLEELTV